MERFADIQLLRYKLKGFENLSLQQKLYIYHLSLATTAGRDILFDQNGEYNLAIRDLLEAVYTNYQGDREDANFKGFEVYLDADIDLEGEAFFPIPTPQVSVP